MSNLSEGNSFSEKKVIDISLKLVLIFILVGWCAMILLPFITILLWSIILAITIYPMFDSLTRKLKGKKILSASIITVSMLVILLVPFVLLISSIFDEAKELGASFRSDTLVIPPPDPKVADWPLIGNKLYLGWKSLNENLEATVMQYKDQLLDIGHKIFQSLMGLISNVLMFTASIIIAGVFLVGTDQAQKSTRQFSSRLAGNMGEELMTVVVQTIRNVAKGIIGVAFIQFVIMGGAFLFAGIPFAGIWGLLVFLLALVQLPTIIVALPVIIYMYSVKDPLPATIWAIVIFLAGLSDNVLKPWLMGKGAPVPMLVIFLGALGGFVLSGFIGLFTGAIILSIGYKLGGLWMENKH